MKRFPSFLCFLMAAAISASLTGCGGSPAQAAPPRDSRLTRLPRALSRRPVSRRLTPPGRRIIMCLERALPEPVPEGEPSTLSGGSEQGQNVPNSPEDQACPCGRQRREQLRLLPARAGESGSGQHLL